MSERAAFLPRLSQGQQALVPVLADCGVRTTVSPLYYAGHNPELSLVPSTRRMGSVLDPCTHIRQKPWVERPPAFRGLPFGNNAEPYDPDTAALTEEELVRLALEPVDAQRSRGGTILLTTFHVAGAVGTRGRDVELLLAHLAIEHFRREGIAEPPPFAAVDVRRELYAVVAVDVRTLRSPTARAALADAYLGLGADGLWVKIAGFHEAAPVVDIRAGGAFLSALREGGRPVVACGPGQLHLGLLADDVSASIGLAESERFGIPTTWPAKEPGKQRRGRTRMAYHAKLHRSFRVGSDDAARAFSAAPCDCGVHAPTEPPTGLLVARHAATLRGSQAAVPIDGEREDRREWLLGSAAKASWTAEDAGLAGKHTSDVCYRALFIGLDGGQDEAVLGEQTDF